MSLKVSDVFILGVAGGSGSGKTTFANTLAKKLGDQKSVIIAQDNYYHDQSDKFDKDGGAVNFDHPNAIDFKLLADHLCCLKNNQVIEVPTYDFATHRRLDETNKVSPKPLIILDGILLLSDPLVFDCLDESVFVHTDEKTRFNRRLKRDIEERGRTEEGVREQFFNQVVPMHNKYVEPSQEKASYIIKDDNDFDALIDKYFLYFQDF